MYDMEPIDSPVADMILDPTYINTAWQMSMQEEQEEEGGAEEGGAEDDFDIDGLLSNAGFGSSDDAAEEQEEPEQAPPEVQANEFLGKALRHVSVEVE